jgi:DDE_Tnp_1-associated
MAKEPMGSIRKRFSKLEDPLIDWKKLHQLLDIIMLAIWAVVCGIENWLDIANFGKARID